MDVKRAGLSIILPGTWAIIPIDDDKERDNAISTVIRRQIGRDDRLVRLRRETREQLRDIAARARSAHANLLALSLDLLPGVPFPAAMVAHYADWGDPPYDGERTVGERLAFMLPGGEILDFESGPAIRTFRAATIHPGSTDIPDIELEYYLSVPSGRKLLHIVCDVPIQIDPELIAALVDSMVDSIRWYPDDDVD